MQDLPQLILAQLAHAMQTLELRKITRQIFFGRYTSHIFIAGAASDFLHIISQIARRCIVVNLCNIRHIHAHAEGFGADHHNCLPGAESLLRCVLLHTVQTAIVTANFILHQRGHGIVDFLHCRGKWAVDQRFAAFGHKLFDLLCNMIDLKFVPAPFNGLFQRMNIKVDVVTAYTTQIQDWIVQLQGVDGILHHVILPAIHSSSGQAKDREV